MRELQKRFESFLTAIGATSLDGVAWDSKFEGLKRPDYLLAQRDMVFEIKCITNSPEYKATEEIDKHRERSDFPLFFGSVNIQDILSRLPDGAEINKRIYSRVTKQLDDYLHQANKQLRAAKSIVGERMAGTLIVLNDTVDILDPKIVAHRLTSRLRMRKSDDAAYPDVDFVLIFDERNVMVGKDGARTYACISIEGDRAASFVEQSRFIDELQANWAKFNEKPLFWAENNLGGFEREVKGKPKVLPPNSGMKRYEFWEQQYLHNRYLEILSDEDLLRHGANLMNAIGPHVAKTNGKRSRNREALMELTEGWQHFLTEAKLRGLPLNRLQEYLKWPLDKNG